MVDLHEANNLRPNPNRTPVAAQLWSHQYRSKVVSIVTMCHPKGGLLLRPPPERSGWFWSPDTAGRGIRTRLWDLGGGLKQIRLGLPRNFRSAWPLAVETV